MQSRTGSNWRTEEARKSQSARDGHPRPENDEFSGMPFPNRHLTSGLVCFAGAEVSFDWTGVDLEIPRATKTVDKLLSRFKELYPYARWRLGGSCGGIDAPFLDELIIEFEEKVGDFI